MQTDDQTLLAPSTCSDDLRECLEHHEKFATRLISDAKVKLDLIAEMDAEPSLRPDFKCQWKVTRKHNIESAEWDNERGLMHQRFAAAIRDLINPNTGGDCSGTPCSESVDMSLVPKEGPYTHPSIRLCGGGREIWIIRKTQTHVSFMARQGERTFGRFKWTIAEFMEGRENYIPNAK